MSITFYCFLLKHLNRNAGLCQEASLEKYLLFPYRSVQKFLKAMKFIFSFPFKTKQSTNQAVNTYRNKKTCLFFWFSLCIHLYVPIHLNVMILHFYW